MQVSEILQLSVAERIRIVGEIWDSISDTPDELALTEAEKHELDRRLAGYEKKNA